MCSEIILLDSFPKVSHLWLLHPAMPCSGLLEPSGNSCGWHGTALAAGPANILSCKPSKIGQNNAASRGEFPSNPTYSVIFDKLGYRLKWVISHLNQTNLIIKSSFCWIICNNTYIVCFLLACELHIYLKYLLARRDCYFKLKIRLK